MIAHIRQRAKRRQDAKVGGRFAQPHGKRQERDAPQRVRGFQRVQTQDERAEHLLEACADFRRQPARKELENLEREFLAHEEKDQTGERDAEQDRRRERGGFGDRRQIDAERHERAQREHQKRDQRDAVGNALQYHRRKTERARDCFAFAQRVRARKFAGTPGEHVVQRKADDEHGKQPHDGNDFGRGKQFLPTRRARPIAAQRQQRCQRNEPVISRGECLRQLREIHAIQRQRKENRRDDQTDKKCEETTQVHGISDFGFQISDHGSSSI